MRAAGYGMREDRFRVRSRGPPYRSPTPEGPPVRINLTSLFVDDQEKALAFYTEVLGFVKKATCRSASTGG